MLEHPGKTEENEPMADITVNEELCKGCELCVNACPKKIMKLDEKKINAKGYHPAMITDKSKCIACAACATMCPDVAITIGE